MFLFENRLVMVGESFLCFFFRPQRPNREKEDEKTESAASSLPRLDRGSLSFGSPSAQDSKPVLIHYREGQDANSMLFLVSSLIFSS